MTNQTNDQLKTQIIESEKKIKQLTNLMESARAENRMEDVRKYQRVINMVTTANKNYQKYLSDRINYFEHGQV